MTANPVWHAWRIVLVRLIAACIAAFFIAAPSNAERLALVVGNAGYDVAPDLANPINDATSINNVDLGRWKLVIKPSTTLNR